MTEEEFLEFRNMLTTAKSFGIHTVCVSKDKYEKIQQRIEWGFGERSEYLSNVRIIEI